ncbi:DHA2 family efflux MFS transporter permease subunit [Alicyclobacillaceae bacterium I2511]|nr:DHA2 family efflux MFS transporter permease subunit [Alicyclobacillaceae bacterium I2511]
MQAHNSAGNSSPAISRQAYLQLVIIILGVFMAILDTSVVTVAIPVMEHDLAATTNQIQWVLTGYMLAIGILVPISGWMTEKVGPKRLFLISLAIFTVGSALSGAAWSLGSLIVFRILQAIGGGFMMPVSMAMIFRLFPPEKRGFVMGLLGIAMMAAPAFGPALSGYFVEYASWRLIFYVNVPIGLLAVPLGMMWMKELPHHVSGKLDVWGFSFSTVGFFSLLYGFNEVPSSGWHSAEVVGLLTLGSVSLLLLVITELNVENPVIQLRVLKNYMFSMSLVITSIINVALFAGLFLLPLYLQDIRGYTALRTGLFMTPAALLSALMMPISGRLMDRIGARPLGIVGLLIVAYGTFGFAHLTLYSRSADIQWLYILRSVGMGMTMMPIMTAGMNTVSQVWVSQGTAMTNTVRQVASSLGTALLTSYMTTQSNLYQATLNWQVTPLSATADWLQKTALSLQGQYGMSAAAAKQEATTLLMGLLGKEGFVAGLNDTFYVSFILAAIAWVLVLFYASAKERAARRGNQALREAGGNRKIPVAASEREVQSLPIPPRLRTE